MIFILLLTTAVLAVFRPTSIIKKLPQDKSSLRLQLLLPLWTKIKKIKTPIDSISSKHAVEISNEPPKIKLSPDQLLQKLNVLSALPDDIQVKIILDTQNAQNAIQWLKMNKESADKLFKDPKFQPILPEVLKLSIMDKYYDADILKRILNLVNWRSNVYDDVQYIMDIYQFAKVIKDIDLSSAAGRQIKEYTLLSIGKFIDENPGKAFKTIPLNSDIMGKIIQSDAAISTKFSNDLSLGNRVELYKFVVNSGENNNINALKLLLDNPKLTKEIGFIYFQHALSKAIQYKNTEYIAAIFENHYVASRLYINNVFREADAYNNVFALEKIINNPELFAKVSKFIINECFLFSASHGYRNDILKLFIENAQHRISIKTFVTAMKEAIYFRKVEIVIILLGATNLWKYLKFSSELKLYYIRTSAEIKNILQKNELFMNKLKQI